MPSPAWNIEQLLGLAIRFGLTRLVLESNERVRVADVEVVLPERESVRPRKPVRKHEALIYPAVAVRVTQYGHAARLRFRNENIAVRCEGHSARLLHLPFGKNADLEAGRQLQLCAFR